MFANPLELDRLGDLLWCREHGYHAMMHHQWDMQCVYMEFKEVREAGSKAIDNLLAENK